MSVYEECKICHQTRSCRFCDFEALKATVEGRPYPSKYIKTFEGYKKVISFDNSNIPPNSLRKKKGVLVKYAKTQAYDLEVLSAFLLSQAEITQDVRLWLAGLFSQKSDYCYQLKISGRAKQGITGRPKISKNRNWLAVEEYKNLVPQLGISKAKEKIMKSYDLESRELNESIKYYDDEQLKKTGKEPLKRNRGRPKKYE